MQREERVKGWDRGVSTQRHKTRGYRPPARGRCSAEGVAVVASKRPLGPRRSPSIPDQPRALVGLGRKRVEVGSVTSSDMEEQSR